MQIETLDHLALWVADRDTLADFACDHLGMHVIDRTEKFTLIGSDARRGKLTLFAADGPREPGALVRIVLRVPDLEQAAAELPAGLAVSHTADEIRFTGPEGLGFGLRERDGVPYDFDHVVLRVPDPDAAFAELRTLGFGVEQGRLGAGGAAVELEAGEVATTERPLLNHLGLRVQSADDHLDEARQRGLEIADVVDGPNTYAIFVMGPGGVKLEYVEHKAGFALV
jgi:catechol 2,3-dioxygenase-like lactoylglutathione lyase family enzyme